jgi:hypothetical protein
VKRNPIRYIRKNKPKRAPPDFGTGRKRLCGARLRKKRGQRCKRFASPDHWRCVLHGSRCCGPRPKFDAEGNRIIPNFDAWQAGRDRYWARRRAAKAALEKCGLKDEWPTL